MTPLIVHSVSDPQGRVSTQYAPTLVRQALNASAVEKILPALKEVVSARGTAKGAAVPGYTVAGKTGTAQKTSSLGGYMNGKYVVSFVGFLPAENPELVGMVVLDDAKTPPNMNYGGLVAAPIFADIAAQAMHHLNVEPASDYQKTAVIGRDEPSDKD